MKLREAMEAAAGAPPRFLDDRFDADKRVLRCPGNTIVCHRRDPEGLAAITELVARIAQAPAGDCFAFTAPSSWHMTLFNGLLHDSDRREGFWPTTLPKDASDRDADAFMVARMAEIDPPDIPITMVPSGLAGLSSHGLGIALSPETPEQGRALCAYRDRLAEATGLEGRPGHDTYRFHLTLAYLVRWPTVTEAAATDALFDRLTENMANLVPPFRLGPPEICLFDNMNEFRVQATVTSAQAATPVE